MIEVRGLTKKYQQLTAVNDVSFSVAEGEIFVLLGTSGSGKTTTLRMINRLIEPTLGVIQLDGKDIGAQPAVSLRRKIGYVLQGYGLFPHYTVGENIAIVPRLLHWDEKKIHQRVDELLEKLQLSPQHYRHLYPSQLSGGQVQRVGLARALAADPPILLMDEPFGALDPLTRAQVRKEFKGLDELHRKTIVLVTHDVQEAFELAGRIGLMDKGCLLQTGTPSHLLLHPTHELVRRFFDRQRLQLEWQALTLKHLWEDLSPGHESSRQDLKSTATIWEALEAMHENQNTVVARDDASNTVRALGFSSLQEALLKLKQRNRDG